MFLCSSPDIMGIFECTDSQDVDDIQYISYLSIARSGLRALELYDHIAKRHRQPQMEARMGIMNFLIQEGIVKLEEVRDAQGKLRNAFIRVDRAKVLSQGQAVMGKLLIDLQVRKSIADGDGARAYYSELTEPLHGWSGELRDLVLGKKQPRKVFIQPNTVVVNGRVELREYSLDSFGVIQSFVERGV